MGQKGFGKKFPTQAALHRAHFTLLISALFVRIVAARGAGGGRAVWGLLAHSQRLCSLDCNTIVLVRPLGPRAKGQAEVRSLVAARRAS